MKTYYLKYIWDDEPDRYSIWETVATKDCLHERCVYDYDAEIGEENFDWHEYDDTIETLDNLDIKVLTKSELFVEML